MEVNVKESIKNFKRVYPEVDPVPVGLTDDGNKIVVFVGDGYHAIDECSVSRFYENIGDARAVI